MEGGVPEGLHPPWPASLREEESQMDSSHGGRPAPPKEGGSPTPPRFGNMEGFVLGSYSETFDLTLGDPPI